MLSTCTFNIIMVHIAGACAGEPWGNRILSYTCPFIVHRTARQAKPASDHHGNMTGCYGDASTCVLNVYQALLSPPEGPGYEANHQPTP